MLLPFRFSHMNYEAVIVNATFEHVRIKVSTSGFDENQQTYK